MKHKYCELIKAWADGAKIEARYYKATGWTDWQEEIGGFIWYQDGAEYRIKPELKEDIVLYSAVHKLNPHKSGSFAWVSCAYPDYQDDAKLKLTFDCKTGELKSAETLK